MPARASTAPQIWAQALTSVASLRRRADLTFPCLLDELADRYEQQPALQGQSGTLSYRTLAQTKNRFARWALQQRLGAGDVVGLMMPNGPDYVAIWSGISQVGVTVALINTELRGDMLLHALRCSSARVVLAGDTHIAAIDALRPTFVDGFQLWRLGSRDRPGAIKTLDPLSFDCAAPQHTRSPARPNDVALLIFTSGTSGLPKAARISHYRVLEWSYWFAAMMQVTASDRLYACLPMYHSTGGVACVGAMLVSGGTVVIRERFSAAEFWSDISDEACTIFLYIGELCRYLLASEKIPENGGHRLRLCCGNGLRRDVWEKFQARFHVADILEFYASTEGNVSLYNCEQKPGAVGRVPAILAHRDPTALIRCDRESGTAFRKSDGRCVRCDLGETGEVIGQIASGTTAFEGYTDQSATEAKILRDVFRVGDAWFRTGDLMFQDSMGFFYFVDRLGDSLRWKGENVSTQQVADVLRRFPGIREAVVYGVAISGTEGKAGMAALTIGAGFHVVDLHAFTVEHLPSFARPQYLRICGQLEKTSTFKFIVHQLAREGFDASLVFDPLYVLDSTSGQYVLLESPLLKPGFPRPLSALCP